MLPLVTDVLVSLAASQFVQWGVREKVDLSALCGEEGPWVHALSDSLEVRLYLINI